MNIGEAVRKVQIATNTSIDATDVARACLPFVSVGDHPEARMRLNDVVAHFIAQVSLFAHEFGVTEALKQHLERHDEDA